MSMASHGFVNHGLTRKKAHADHIPSLSNHTKWRWSMTARSDMLSSSSDRIDELPLHDGTLKSLHFAWDDGQVVLQIALHDAPESMLIFKDVKSLEVPCQQPWGRSASINQARMTAVSTFEVEMQSGDTIRITADDWTFQLRPGRHQWTDA